LHAVLGLDHLEAGIGQKVAQDLPIVFLILDHENSLGHTFSRSACCCSTLTGRLIENVAPLPSSDSTQMRPPCISMMRRAMDKPSPVPPFFLVAELSACWNSSKILPLSFASMPRPVSRTGTV